MTTLILPPSKAAQRYEALDATQGYYAETFQREAISAAQLMVTGSIYYLPIGLLAGDLVTNIHVQCQVLGSGFSGIGFKAGLCTKAGVQLAASGDVSAAMGSTGVKTLAMATPYLVPASDAYLIELLGIATTMPTLFRGFGNPGANVLVTGAAVGAHGVQTSQTDFPTPGVPSYSSIVNLGFWAGVS